MKNKIDKEIYLTLHAKDRMYQRGATEGEIIQTINNGEKEPAKRGKWHVVYEFALEPILLINKNYYNRKTLDVVFVEESEKIVVLTVKVYYHKA